MTTITTIRLGLAASLAGLCLAATACGTDSSANGPSTPERQPSPATSRYAEHPPGSFHAETYCRSHPGHGVIRCSLPGPQRRVGHAWS
jgi:hypothetical protein